ncbi:MAG: type II toxin-antitoxin system HicB family antitoxin [Gammaproteobacteria bacterium]|nr:type II toxin-antitoxin system HicB family antitoxin [Gammaproteobacteria bacterium]
MTYKGYTATVEFDSEADLLHGQVINTADVITFQCRSVDDLEKEFHTSVDDYLAFCEQEGDEPEKPFSGQFVVRTTPDIHREIFIHAKKSGVSINQWLNDQLAVLTHT